MLILTDRKKFKKKLAPGTYASKVKKVAWATTNEDRYVVSYELTDAQGNKFPHCETFNASETNVRTADFEGYLMDNGIKDLDDFIGKKENVTISEVESYDGKTYMNITAREFIHD